MVLSFADMCAERKERLDGAEEEGEVENRNSTAAPRLRDALCIVLCR